MRGLHRNRSASGFTLVELLVVIAIIGILIGMLLPAVQQVREAARRTQCLNQLKQMALAMHNYEGSFQQFPPGFTYDRVNAVDQQVFWSAFVLPQLEQNSLFETLDLEGSFTLDGSANEAACSVFLEVFQCPSANVAKSIADGQGIPNRVPCNYLGCATGTIALESGSGPLAGDPLESDGLLFENSEIKFADMRDGSSNIVLVGEALFDFELNGLDTVGSPEIVDHWYIGSDFLAPNPADNSADVSEVIGSTACAINSDPDLVTIDEVELCFSSNHPGGAQVAFGDGHAEFIRETIDRVVWSALGTRNGGEVVGSY